MSKSAAELKAEILRLAREYSELTHLANRPALENPLPFHPGETNIPYAGRVFTADEVEAAVDSTLDFWLTLGPHGEAFERELASLLGVKHSLLVNSGSSANLVAFSALTTHKLPADRRIQPGDEVITVAAGFPTTVTPILQSGAIPVFLDNNPITGNICTDLLETSYVKGKTKAVMLAHALGNPFDIGTVLEFCRRYNLWLIEDNCDALGCTYSMPIKRANALGFFENSPGIPPNGTHITRYTGTWGDISTQSFYPPHHLTMGEGGAVNIVSRPPLKSYAESFRDWGRDCWCASGKDDTCGKRFGWQLGELPEGYDHKYIYSHLGYNLKPLDPQAAIGRQQLKKLPAFIEARKRNWETLRRGLAGLETVFEFSLPTHAVNWSESGFEWDSTGCRTDCSWFGFMIRIKPDAPFSRTDLAKHLDQRKIGNRMLFGGNLLRQPVFVQLLRDRPSSIRMAKPLKEFTGADEIMNNSLFLGTYPGLTAEMLKYIIDVIRDFATCSSKSQLQ
jgi:CDP-6-deoxy-D-xylo-4-hexulose-3-dehydrase